MPYEILAGALSPLILPAVRDIIWGLFFRYKAWRGNPEYTLGVRYSRLISSSGGCNYGTCTLEHYGWFQVDLRFPDGRLPLSNRKFKRFDGIIARLECQSSTIRAMPRMPIHDP